MLINLHVKNLALIEEADMNFAEGLNIITGETGAGKSILIGSINAALGNKVSADFVREGAAYGLVELTFHVDNPQTIEKLKALDVSDAEDGDVVITRKIIQGRSTIKVNGETKVAAQVREITSLLIDIHGQHEHQSLMNRSNYIPIIDKYAKAELAELKPALKDAYAQYVQAKKRLEQFNLDPEGLKREQSFMQYEIDEIDRAQLHEGEDDELEQTFRLYHNSRKIMEGISEAMQLLSLDNENAADMIGRALRAVHQVADYDRENLQGILSQLSDIEDILNGVNSDMSSYADKMDFDEEEYRRVDERLSLINELKLKYGKNIRDILEYRNGREEKLQEYLSYEENKEKAQQELLQSEKKALELCDRITQIRKEASVRLDADIKKALLELNFLDVQFETRIETTESFHENGNNEAEFLISTNPGESMRPLSKVASGGELSRIMLAIKTVLSDKDEIETLIFDEIDTGISGRTAQMVAVKLGENSRHHQVLCITHLPQIAAMADHHFLIEKNVVENKTRTSIYPLQEKESIRELARLLGGTSITENVLNNAKELKEQAAAFK
jgi:DNA repair protein RecN (Recombination protein N)